MEKPKPTAFLLYVKIYTYRTCLTHIPNKTCFNSQHGLYWTELRPVVQYRLILTVSSKWHYFLTSDEASKTRIELLKYILFVSQDPIDSDICNTPRVPLCLHRKAFSLTTRLTDEIISWIISEDRSKIYTILKFEGHIAYALCDEHFLLPKQIEGWKFWSVKEQFLDLGMREINYSQLTDA